MYGHPSMLDTKGGCIASAGEGGRYFWIYCVDLLEKGEEGRAGLG